MLVNNNGLVKNSYLPVICQVLIYAQWLNLCQVSVCVAISCQPTRM